MIDKRKVAMMTKLAFYEQTQGKEDFKVCEYYRKDYVGFHMLSTIIWITIGYICAGGLAAVALMDVLLADMSTALLLTLALIAVVVYFALIILYALITNYVYKKKHKEAKRRLKKYNHDLIDLLKYYDRERR